MASQGCCSDHICTFVPDYFLQSIVDNHAFPETTRVCSSRTLTHINNFRAARAELMYDNSANNSSGSIIPDYIHQQVIDSPDASEEDKGRAQKSLAQSRSLRTARAGGSTAPASRLRRMIYDAESMNDLPGSRIRKEGDAAVQDVSANEVYDDFKYTFDLYNEIFKRNSIDDRGMTLIGTVHFDDEEPPPGFNNAFWDGRQMVFGDGDNVIFASFTKSIDVIGHELTHGVTQYTARLPYHSQSGALNEHISDAFGIMVKQYHEKTKAADANWLIGEGIFAPGFQGRALRDMKAPGTAYDDPRYHMKDRQPGHMKDYVELPDDDNPKNDSGGVHINSGIPNKAFQLVATSLGVYAWDKAGPIWYKSLLDPRLRRWASQSTNWTNCFPIFAALTIAHAADYGAVDAVKKAWEAVGVTPGNL